MSRKYVFSGSETEPDSEYEKLLLEKLLTLPSPEPKQSKSTAGPYDDGSETEPDPEYDQQEMDKLPRLPTPQLKRKRSPSADSEFPPVRESKDSDNRGNAELGDLIKEIWAVRSIMEDMQASQKAILEVLQASKAVTDVIRMKQWATVVELRGLFQVCTNGFNRVADVLEKF